MIKFLQLKKMTKEKRRGNIIYILNFFTISGLNIFFIKKLYILIF
jgi:hypothetical protein